MRSNLKAYFFDTSALLKRYFFETNSGEVSKIFKENPIIFVASLTYAEVYATFSRIKREGLIIESALKSLISSFESDWAKFAIVNFDKDVRDLAKEIIFKYPLRGADLVQFSSAATLFQREIKFKFAATDKVLHNAAVDFGIEVLRWGKQ